MTAGCCFLFLSLPNSGPFLPSPARPRAPALFLSEWQGNLSAPLPVPHRERHQHRQGAVNKPSKATRWPPDNFDAMPPFTFTQTNFERPALPAFDRGKKVALLEQFTESDMGTCLSTERPLAFHPSAHQLSAVRQTSDQRLPTRLMDIGKIGHCKLSNCELV